MLGTVQTSASRALPGSGSRKLLEGEKSRQQDQDLSSAKNRSGQERERENKEEATRTQRGGNTKSAGEGEALVRGATRPKSAGKAADHQLLAMVEGADCGDLGEDTHVSSSGQQLHPHLAPRGLIPPAAGSGPEAKALIPLIPAFP